MLRILTRTAVRPPIMHRVAPTTRCSCPPLRDFLRSTTTVAADAPKPSAVDEPAIISSKDMPQLDPELVDPVFRWLLDEQNTLETPHIPVKAEPLANIPTYLPMAYLQPVEKSQRKLVPLDKHIFFHPMRRDILHACVVWYLDGLRRGTASTKTRAEVAYSGKKIRPQKGSGRARLGDRGSPMLRGGGVAFGPKPRDFKTLLPRKVKEMGMRVALSVKVKERRLGIVPHIRWNTFKTNAFAKRFSQLGWGKTLFVTGREEVEKNFLLATRNVQDVEVMKIEDVQVYHLLKWPRVILDLNALQWIEAQLARDRLPMVEEVAKDVEASVA